MVSTRRHPQAFSSDTEQSPTKAITPSNTISRSSRPLRSAQWTHTPSNLTLIWLAVSLPLVIWDTGYVLLRPLSMPGGSLHWPLWTPYELYGRVDHIYGWKAFNARNGFTSAQGSMNTIETLMYLYYLYIMWAYGRSSTAKGRGAPKPETVGVLGQQRSVDGIMGAVAVIVAYSAAVMTLSKTILYWLNEAFSGFDNIGHNSAVDLLFLWIIPNGAWIALPTYMIYVSGAEIIQGLTIAAGGAGPSSDDTLMIKDE